MPGFDARIMYLILRSDLITDLKWSIGAVATQAAHAATACIWTFRDDSEVMEYMRDISHLRKVTLKVPNEMELRNFEKKLQDSNVDYYLWTEDNMAVCIALKPQFKSFIEHHVKHLKLLGKTYSEIYTAKGQRRVLPGIKCLFDMIPAATAEFLFTLRAIDPLSLLSQQMLSFVVHFMLRTDPNGFHGTERCHVYANAGLSPVTCINPPDRSWHVMQYCYGDRFGERPEVLRNVRMALCSSLGKYAFVQKQAFPASPNVCCDEYSEVLLTKLEACKLPIEITDVLDSLTGGWAIIYFRADLKKIFVGRDVFGRKSLLWTRVNAKFYFSSFVCNRTWNWRDVPSGTITVLDLCSDGNNTLFYVFEVAKSWIQQFDKLNKVQRKLVSERLAVSHELSSQKLRREATAKSMLEWLTGAIHRTFCDINRETRCILIPFSGGVDSLLITHMLAQCLPSDVFFDLVNVAFDKTENYDAAPDRPQSKNAYKYMKSCYPERCIRLILVNVTLDELVQCRKKYISGAVTPACFVMDDAIGCIQWFAARGEGILYEDEGKPVVPGNTEFLKSEAKIVVVGSGADELFGGYMRHRTIYLKKGRKAVLDELYQELKRIGERNLGRDDRVVSSLNKDLRSPYLDDVFVEWVTSLPLEHKTDYTKPRGTGEKWLIREALRLLGTPEALCATPKRAMQFGTRMAKLENRAERGDDICPRLVQEQT